MSDCGDFTLVNLKYKLEDLTTLTLLKKIQIPCFQFSIRLKGNCTPGIVHRK